jgi:hypothetical protein
MDKSCLYCDRLRGCNLLFDRYAELDDSKIIMPGDNIECPSWTPVMPRQEAARNTLFAISGKGAIRAFHTMPTGDTDNTLRELEEKEQEMKEDTPNFLGMIVPGMTASQRQEQLSYDTSDDGSELKLEDDGRGSMVPHPRPSYQVRNYATDINGPIKMTWDEGLCYSTEDIIKRVIKAEIKMGLIQKDPKDNDLQDQEEEDMTQQVTRTIISRGPAQQAPAAVQSAPQPTQQAPVAPQRRSLMPAKAVAAATSGDNGRVSAGPPRKAGAPSVAAQASAPVNTQVESNVGISKEALIAVVGAAMTAIKEQIVKEVTSAILAKMEETTHEISSHIVTNQDKCIEATTMLCDILSQTKGTMIYDDGNTSEAIPPFLGEELMILSAYEYFAGKQ